MTETDGWTNKDLIEGALKRGYILTERKIVDWTAHGLLDRPKVRGTGRGSQLSVRPDHQAELLWVLLKQQTAATKIAALANIPVYAWLGWGERYISIGQVRKAMRTFADDEGHSPATRARQTARDHLNTLNLDLPPSQRRELENVIIDATATDLPNLDHFAQRFAPALQGVTSADGTTIDRATIDNTVWVIDCRLRAAHAFRTGADATLFPDQTLRSIQAFHQQTASEYASKQQLNIRDLHQELANRACVTLLLHLGRQLSPVPPTGT